MGNTFDYVTVLPSAASIFLPVRALWPESGSCDLSFSNPAYRRRSSNRGPICTLARWSGLGHPAYAVLKELCLQGPRQPEGISASREGVTSGFSAPMVATQPTADMRSFIWLAYSTLEE